MKVVYKKSIRDQIIEARIEARKQMREIAYIELTKEDLRSVRASIDRDYFAPYISDGMTFLGCKIKLV